MIIEVSLIIPTYNRSDILFRTIKSIAEQEYQPNEILVIDASLPFVSAKETWRNNLPHLRSEIVHVPANNKGAAIQRNQGIALAKYNIIGFADDDIILEPGCFETLYNGLKHNAKCGGINATISNQFFHPLGIISKIAYKLMGINISQPLAGKCIGPVITFLPNGPSKSSQLVEVDWLNTTCTFYRREAFPNPVFDQHFTGYSLMEDLALSLKVGKNWTLLNSPTSVIYHDSQPGEEKSNLLVIAEMDLVNRYYIMKFILNRISFKYMLQLFLQQIFIGLSTKQFFMANFWKAKIRALKKIRKL